MIEILATPPLNSVQDFGREGHRDLGLGRTGAMDRIALAAANAMLGNEAGAAGIEVQLFPFRVRFTEEVTFALTGADCMARLGGRVLPPWWVGRAKQGEVLVLGGPISGARAYLVPAGGIDVPEVLGSRSTQLRSDFGGHEGRALQAGDLLPIGRDHHTRPRDAAGFGADPAEIALAQPSADGAIRLRTIPAAEYDHFTPESHEAFWSDAWTVSVRSNRQGVLMSGARKVVRAQPTEMRSHGLMPGVVQVPPGGAPIIQLSDANPAGGYPKIGGVIEADLWRLGQARPGSLLRFIRCDFDEAQAAMAANLAWLGRLRRTAALCRTEG